MKCLLDTNICIYIIKKKPIKVIDRFRDFKPGDLGISSITLSELCYGVEKSQELKRNQLALEEFLIPLEVVDYDGDAAFHYGKIRTHLEKAGTPISLKGSMDLMIAAHALALGIPVVTNNVKEFKRVPGLSLENWT